MAIFNLFSVVKCGFAVLTIFFFFLSRLGFVFILNTDEVVDGNEDAGVALWRAFNFIADEVDISQAFVSILYVSVCKKIKILLYLRLALLSLRCKIAIG